MPSITFQLDGGEVAFDLVKHDRTKLYGFRKIEVSDPEGLRCDLATLAGDGQTIIPSGGIAMAYTSADGSWLERSELKPVDMDGMPIRPVQSSLKAPVELRERVDPEVILEHKIRLVYQLDAGEIPIDGPIADALSAGGIFRFPFSYRGGIGADVGFLLRGADGNAWLLVGTPVNIEMLGLAESAGMDEELEAEDFSEDFDFELF